MSRGLSRREFVAGAAALLASCSEAPPPGPRKHAGTAVDTHVHCFAGYDNPRYPYAPDAPYKPPVAARPDQLLRCMDGAGVDFAVIVHPEPYQDDHSYLEYCLEEGKGRLKGTCLFFADRPGSTDRMAELVKRCPAVAALRIHAYAPERLSPLASPAMKALWRRAADLGLMLQIHFEPRWAPGYEPLLEEFSGTKVIIDHAGRPLQGTPEEHARVVSWSKYPNTVVKLSAILSREEYPHRDAAPFVKRLADAFGPDRMITGGGFKAGATPESYLAERERLMSYVSHFSEADRAKVAGGTAAKLFKFL